MLRAAGCVYAEEEADLLTAEARDDEDLDQLVRRRLDGEPIEHVVGWAAFAELRLTVQRGVFVPRRRTELLAREAVLLSRPGSVVAELCCGCAPVASVVAATVPETIIVAADIDPVAVACATRNLPPDAEVCCGDLYDALPERVRGRVDVLAANAPYVPHGELDLMPREARLHEPSVALDGGPDGLELHRRLLAGSGEWLAEDGHVLVEVAAPQAPETLVMFEAQGLRSQVIEDLELGATVIVGHRVSGVSVT